ncbi:JAB domain-containing protein [Intestinibacter bartlettii]|uniref:DNA repair protein RadC n=1 Tax=Intestinibacter bartlettii TaxID=261299 RepID=A0ABS8CZY8_9FIRM|nr:JAB domain-containing protein [Intestinibacter bartlettii]MCB5397640.1 DNA repair protein RadC [Intestinibacter bartlettii]MCB5404950.1 DNA repair protein RadC [Intestinibacter bartlettii]MCB5446452.1 DNA repair protein RadC [Intestinibacter bartlettii]MCB5749179.1 DNA repair protein RadC [Intestinibacter bartlettii]
MENKHAKRVDIVSIKMVREGSTKYENRKIETPFDAYVLLKNFLEDSDREKLLVVCLDTKNQPINICTVSVGTLNSSLVHPREIFKTAILSNSNQIMLAHNHPSGISAPSNEDKAMTNRIKDAGVILGIELIDHIIIGSNEYFSFKENRLM